MEEPEVMLGTFNVHSTPSTIRFYSGASHSFISQAFVRMHSIPLCAMKNPILVNSPGGSMLASYRCLPTSLSLRGIEFQVSPIVLRTAGIDLILGMDWMTQQQVVIHCKEKAVVLTTSKGDKISVEVVVQKQQTATVNQLGDSTNKEDLVVDVFPDDLLGMLADRDIEFIIELLPGTAPILSIHIE
jgi:hypothetical protein